MTVRVDPQSLARLFGPRLKLIVAAADLAEARALCDLAGEEVAGLDVLALHPGPRLVYAGEIYPKEWTDLPAPPSGPCVLAAVSYQAHAPLQELLAWWKEHAPDAPPLVNLAQTPPGEARRATLYRHLTRLALEEVQGGAERQTELTAQLYELRQLHEQGRVAQQAMQQQLWNLQSVPCHLRFVLLPAADSHLPVGPGPVRQPLPGAAEGFAGLDLFSPARRGWCTGGEGHLLVTLRAREADRDLGSWSIAYGELGRGWYRCSLPAALSDAYRCLDITVAYHTTRGTPPALALADVGPWQELSATAAGKPLGQALALMLWAATPGRAVGAGPAAFAASPVEYQLAPDDFADLEPTAATSGEHVQLLPDMPGFRLHARGRAAASARLPQKCLPGTERLVAVTQLRDPAARGPVEAAICLTRAEAGCPAFPADPEKDDRVLAFSGWQTVPADHLPHAVTLRLDSPLEAVADLHVATRIPRGRGAYWADWLELRVQLRRAG